VVKPSGVAASDPPEQVARIMVAARIATIGIARLDGGFMGIFPPPSTVVWPR
jgi:hypothetical protein